MQGWLGMMPPNAKYRAKIGISWMVMAHWSPKVIQEYIAQQVGVAITEILMSGGCVPEAGFFPEFQGLRNWRAEGQEIVVTIHYRSIESTHEQARMAALGSQNRPDSIESSPQKALTRYSHPLTRQDQGFKPSAELEF